MTAESYGKNVSSFVIYTFIYLHWTLQFAKALHDLIKKIIQSMVSVLTLPGHLHFKGEIC